MVFKVRIDLVHTLTRHKCRGGSVIDGLLAPRSGTPVPTGDIIAVVRKEEHVVKMAKLGIEVIVTALSGKAAMERVVLDNDGK